MDRRELRRRPAQRPHAVRFSELDRLLDMYGVTLERVRGSHQIYGHEGERFIIPYRRGKIPAPHVLVVTKRLASKDENNGERCY